MPKTVFIDGATPVGADYLNGRNNHNHRGEDTDSSNAKILPENEINWGVDSLFTISSFTDNEYRLAKSGGRTLWWPDMLQLGEPGKEALFEIVNQGDSSSGKFNTTLRGDVLYINMESPTQFREVRVEEELVFQGAGKALDGYSLTRNNVTKSLGYITIDTAGNVTSTAIEGAFIASWNAGTSRWQLLTGINADNRPVFYSVQTTGGNRVTCTTSSNAGGVIEFDIVSTNSLNPIQPGSPPLADLIIYIEVK